MMTDIITNQDEFLTTSTRIWDPDKLDLTRFSGYKFRSTSAKGACRSFAPRAQSELKSTARSFTWESIQDQTIQRLCSEASQPLTSLHPAHREVTGAVPTSICGFKVHRMKGDKDQLLNSTLGYVQKEVIHRHVRRGKA
ncbi:hypothetical protein TNCV_4686331 [Trichonephila clavipes]|nr:hypothetical protein TNCV_4686331 [Trichonephila clavipes]